MSVSRRRRDRMGKTSGHAITGLGVTKQGRLPGVSSVDLRIESLRAAIIDAGITPRDVGGYVYQPGATELGTYCMAGEVPKLMGISTKFVWNVQGGGTSAMLAIVAACAAIDAGVCDYVAVGYGDTMLSSSTVVGAAGMLGDTSYDTMGGYGMYSPGADHALAARRHMYEFGTTREQLGAVALNARRNANLREDAFMHDKPLTMEDYLSSRRIADPLVKFDNCLIADGGCAFIVTSADRAKDAPKPPVFIDGVGFGHSITEAFRGDAYRRSAVKEAGDTALRKAGVTIEDIDVAQIYDCFTITVLMALEGFGFCGIGEGGPFAADGNIALNGSIPINTAGGELSWGYMQGFTPIVEGIRQMRGEGGPTQIADAELCLVSGHGGTYKDAGTMEYADGAMILRRN
ncbi:thiolase family protein [Rhodococcus sp. WS4]|nr:thiolase family protein [Rhodococcus sp. WS4]